MLPQGFDGIIVNNPQELSEALLPFAFDGIIISYSLDTVFITVKNGLGKAIEGVSISTTYLSQLRNSITDSNGLAIMEIENNALFTLNKEKAYLNKNHNKTLDGDIFTIVFQPPLLT